MQIKKQKLALAGCGYLANIVMDAYCSGLLPEYEMLGVSGRTREHAVETASKCGCAVCDSMEELLELEPDYLVEAASVQTVRDIAEPALSRGVNLVVLSIGAFADETFYRRIRSVAREHNARVHLASGAIGGFDVLRTVSLMGAVKTEMVTHKGPASLQNTPVFREGLMEETEETRVFSGTAREAIGLLPTKVNVAIAASLATAGPDSTRFHIYSVPGMTGDDHRIEAEVDGVKAVVDIYSSTSAIAGWSVVSLLQNLVSPIVF